MRLRRSIAWANGYDCAHVEELIGGCCDAITMDLEDGIPPARKDEARAGTREILGQVDFRGVERIVRVNSLESGMCFKDLQEVVAPGLPDAIRLPKCERPGDILRVDEELSRIEDQAGLERNRIEILAMIESPLGVHNAYDLASCCKRVTALSLGMEDLTKELGVKRRYTNNSLDLIYARQKLVMEAAAAGIVAIDSSILTNDLKAVELAAEESRQIGFAGRSVRGEEEAVIANRIYAPAADDVAFARTVVAEYERQTKEKRGDVFVGREFICYARYERSLELIAQAERIAAKEHERGQRER
ncbi:MAG: CoA ester lyase [Pyramidobacter sp.]|nr:CoA ester lyase [Pyramidobacter sp.]